MTDPVVSVQQQLFPPGPPPPDTITMYEGATQFKPWKAWDVRGWLNRLVWDLLRFQKLDDHAPPADRTQPLGLRDTVTTIWFLTDQNNKLLKAIATNAGVSSVSQHLNKAHLDKTKATDEFELPFDDGTVAYVQAQNRQLESGQPQAHPASGGEGSDLGESDVTVAERQLLAALRKGQLVVVTPQQRDLGEG
jgi:hypothetical protein